MSFVVDHEFILLLTEKVTKSLLCKKLYVVYYIQKGFKKCIPCIKIQIKIFFCGHVQVVRNIIINFKFFLIKLIQVFHVDFVLVFFLTGHIFL